MKTTPITSIPDHSPMLPAEEVTSSNPTQEKFTAAAEEISISPSGRALAMGGLLLGAAFSTSIILSIYIAPQTLTDYTLQFLPQAAYAVPTELYLITALTGSALCLIPKIENLLKTHISGKPRLMLARIACYAPLLAMGCIQLADTSAALAGYKPFVFAIDITNDPSLMAGVNGFAVIILQIIVMASSYRFLTDKIIAHCGKKELNDDKLLNVHDDNALDLSEEGMGIEGDQTLHPL
jgi:hypothetical protein